MKGGYYCWVKDRGSWVIALIKDNRVFIAPNSFSWSAEYVEEIGDYIETPDKYKDN